MLKKAQNVPSQTVLTIWVLTGPKFRIMLIKYSSSDSNITVHKMLNLKCIFCITHVASLETENISAFGAPLKPNPGRCC